MGRKNGSGVPVGEPRNFVLRRTGTIGLMCKFPYWQDAVGNSTKIERRSCYCFEPDPPDKMMDGFYTAALFHFVYCASRATHSYPFICTILRRENQLTSVLLASLSLALHRALLSTQRNLAKCSGFDGDPSSAVVYFFCCPLAHKREAIIWRARSHNTLGNLVRTKLQERCYEAIRWRKKYT